ncbi:hypothetical protein C5167_013515 [Papaver somniferum]|uniref:Peptidase M16 N-terminal domain-containing protein n=1 Tax=Papaver somniferum TaxID=3469 RepID=A0A4Y7J0K2_PAPSO|nr:probable mitochondrial-processing peptidase subunit beta, mitochondrial [Papaver somniferum]XP_026455632.1 probable mitochondrial-processing peptidase subunit beta, mitochondrial [Papaver somniferum]XP_026455633.1 probable mitochondrial-processing peptidase subunit beta, mitochondrial [Papaver somniferum]XP_026455634.1 probable mitochondrial-processing peptidase subunit beta, mitochondrial [Papaver somniferum]XP_026455635.1 probable mitochondrial-processing peptidase subunit beta, mitochondr
MALKHSLRKTHTVRKLNNLTHTCPFISTSQSSGPSLMVTCDQPAALIESNRLEKPNPKFLKYSLPHPVVIDPSIILSFPETRVTTLPNGLRVATESNLAAKTATISAWIDAGSRHDTDETSGAAHYVEHIKLNSACRMSKEERQEKIQDMGGCLSAKTAREYTAYNLTVRDKYVPNALYIIADILQKNSYYSYQDVDFLRNIILQEKQAVERCPEKLIFDHLHTAAFLSSPLGRTVLGPDHVIKTIHRNKIVDFISTHYTPPRMVIAASGAVKHEDIIDKVKKLITDLPTDPTTASHLAAKEPTIFTASEVRIIDDGVPLAHFAVAFKGASLTDPDSIALMVMQFMLGSWSKNTVFGKFIGSELAQRVAIDNIAESLMPFNKNYRDAGLFGVYACAKADCLDELAHAIMYEINKLKY